MSQKITSKNLTYDNALPPFLARLRGQQASHSGPDPILAAHRRPGQKRSASEEAEDAPVVVDENGNVVDLKDGALEGDGNEKDGSAAQPDRTENTDKENPSPNTNAAQGTEKEKEKVAGIGAARKRKVGRVIGEEESDEERTKTNSKSKTNADDEARIARASADVRRLIKHDGDRQGATNNGDDENPKKARSSPPRRQQQQKKTAVVKSGKKGAAKKIKLSFGDDDDGE